MYTMLYSSVYFLRCWLMIPLKMIYGPIWYGFWFCEQRVAGVPPGLYPSTRYKTWSDAPPGVTRTNLPRPLPPIPGAHKLPLAGWLARRHARTPSGSAWNVAINEEEEIFEAPSNGFGFDPSVLMRTQSFIPLPCQWLTTRDWHRTGDAMMGIPSWDFWDDWLLLHLLPPSRAAFSRRLHLWGGGWVHS